LIEMKMTFADAQPKLLQKVADETAGIKLVINVGELEKLVNPFMLIESCSVRGGPAPLEVKRALADRERRLNVTRTCISNMDKALEKAENKLESALASHFSINCTNTRLKNSKW
jgi:hypothetical protein